MGTVCSFVATTVVAILATDLLKGITVGILFGIFYTLRHSLPQLSSYERCGNNSTMATKQHHLVLAEEVSFFNKASVLTALDKIPEKFKGDH
jgi:MFS superfamily sulfate permease-like transporter